MTSSSPRTRPVPALRAFGVAAILSLIGGVGLTGCSTSTEEDRDAIAVGEDGAVGSLELRSFLLVASEEGEPGRLLGTLNNDSNEAIDVTISDTDDEVTVTVPAESQFPFDTNETVFETVGDAPGALTTITAATAEETTDLSIPVMDGTLEQYEPYLPD